MNRYRIHAVGSRPVRVRLAYIMAPWLIKFRWSK